MSSRVVFALVTAALLSACGKSPQTSGSTAPGALEPAKGAQTEAVPGQPATDAALSAAAEAALSAALGELTQALRKYSFEHQGLPKSIEQMVSAGYLKDMPQAPSGKRFAIDAKTVQVVLVNQ